MKTYKIKIIVLFFLPIVMTFGACSIIKNVSDTLNNFSKLKFKLGDVNNFKISTIDISNINSTNSISAGDVLKITQSVAAKRLPVEFTLGILAQNPNAASKNTNMTSLDAIISNLDWKLYIDNIETVRGTINSPIKVPSGSSSTVIPVKIQLDLFEFFGNKGYDHLINLALAIGGASGSSSRLKIEAKPTVKISGVPIEYNNYITIVNTEFSDK